MSGQEQEGTDYASFQNEIYFAGMGGQTPDLPMTFPELEARAKDELDPSAFGYVAGGATSEDTVQENEEAFRRWRIVPRHLRDVAQRDLRVELFGTTFQAPVVLAPIGVQSIVHDEAELAVARAAAELEIPFCLSTVASYPMEEVAEAAGDCPRWFQLYWPAERELTDSFIRRAEAAGYEAIVVTLDTRKLAWRPRDLAGAYLPFLHGQGIANYTSDEVFLEGVPEMEDEEQAKVLRWVQVYSDESQTWEDLEDLCDRTDLPVIVKGVLHPRDAEHALDAGVAGVGVSNHGGRQVDGSIAALDALPDVVEAVGGRAPIVFDSGIRTGSDAMKALALGADVVMLGRPYIYGLGLAGEEGVEHVVRSFLADLDLAMALSGLTTVDELDPDILVRRPGD
jgi:lactate 2-monooxygenase